MRLVLLATVLTFHRRVGALEARSGPKHFDLVLGGYHTVVAVHYSSQSRSQWDDKLHTMVGRKVAFVVESRLNANEILHSLDIATSVSCMPWGCRSISQIHSRGK